MGWLWIALLACAVAVLAAAEWPRLTERVGLEERRRTRARRRSNLRVVRPEEDEDDFAASVQRDLAQLPTIKEGDRKK